MQVAQTPLAHTPDLTSRMQVISLDSIRTHPMLYIYRCDKSNGPLSVLHTKCPFPELHNIINKLAKNLNLSHMNFNMELKRKDLRFIFTLL